MKFVGAWKLSPSDLTFLFDECPACFWNKVAGNFPRPRTPFPKVFTLLDVQTKRFFEGKRTENIASGVRPGRVAFGDRWVRSGPILVPGHQRKLFLAGRFDTALAFDVGTFGIVDFKTTKPAEHHLGLYGRQLHAYTFAAENPAPGNLCLRQVSQMGLLCVEPTATMAVDGDVAYRGIPHWVEIERDDVGFLAFLTGVLDILELSSPPEPAPDCTFCRYVLDGVLMVLARSGAAP
jgi:hypothetical protein